MKPYSDEIEKAVATLAQEHRDSEHGILGGYRHFCCSFVPASESGDGETEEPLYSHVLVMDEASAFLCIELLQVVNAAGWRPPSLKKVSGRKKLASGKKPTDPELTELRKIAELDK